MPYQNSPEPMCPHSILAPELKKSDAPAIFSRVFEILKTLKPLEKKIEKKFLANFFVKFNVIFAYNSVFKPKIIKKIKNKNFVM